MKNIGVELWDSIGNRINDVDVFKTSAVTGGLLTPFPMWKQVSLGVFETVHVSVEALRLDYIDTFYEAD
jgi:putative lipoic acid-binding regulatory protein